MRFIKLFFVLSFCALLCFPAQNAPAEDGKLLKIVALSRHGVRSPTQEDRTLSMWSQKTWPSWPVKRGDLTPRGAELVQAMWGHLRGRFIDQGLLPRQGCPEPGDIFVRADVDERTRATARALLDGVAPGCRLGFAVSGDKVDPLFHPVKAGLYHFDPIPAATDVLAMTGGGLEELQETYSGAMALMGRISGSPAPALCARFTLSPNCQIADLPNAVSVSPDGENVRIVGGLSIASSMAEIFLLEYGQWPGVEAGWGQVNATTLSQLLPVHARIFDVVNRAPLVAWAKGSSLLNEMVSALLGTHYDERCNKARLVVFVGHDTNIANIGSLLGVTWQVSGYPLNSIPPAGVMFLELWEKNGRRHVIVRFFAQTPKTLHAPFTSDNLPGVLSPDSIQSHAPVAGIVSTPPVVGQASFDVSRLVDKVASVTEGAPMAPRQTPPMDFNRIQPGS